MSLAPLVAVSLETVADSEPGRLVQFLWDCGSWGRLDPSYPRTTRWSISVLHWQCSWNIIVVSRCIHPCSVPRQRTVRRVFVLSKWREDPWMLLIWLSHLWSHPLARLTSVYSREWLLKNLCIASRTTYRRFLPLTASEKKASLTLTIVPVYNGRIVRLCIVCSLSDSSVWFSCVCRRIH